MTDQTLDTAFDLEVDVVVLGTGGGGLTAALAAHDFGAGEVLILEKFGMIGGTSAMSGGMLWIPLNDQQEQLGVEDSFEEVVAYVDGLADDGHLDPEAFGAFLEEGPEMLRWFDEKTPVTLRLFEGFPDYQSWAEGAKEHGSRSLDNDVFPFAELGSWAKWVNPPKTGWPRRTSMIEDYYGPKLTDEELADREARDCRGQGQALIGSLLKGVLDRNIPLHRESRARHLITEGKRVIGVETEEGGTTLRIKARKGVIIATGGFEWNEKLVNSFLRGPMTGPVSVPECEGDGLLMAMEVGASLGNMGKSWWLQSSMELAAHGKGKANYLIGNSERTRPRSILVNRDAKRFVNEAANYNAIGPVLFNWDANKHDYVNLPFWIVVDQAYVDKYRFFNTTQAGVAPPWAVSADTRRGARHQARARRRSPEPDGREVQRRRAQRARHRVRAWRQHVRQLLGRPGLRGCLPHPRRHRHGAVLRGPDGIRRPRHVRRPPSQRQRPGHRLGRQADRGAVRVQQRDVLADGGRLRRRRWNARPGDDVRVHRWTARGPASLTHLAGLRAYGCWSTIDWKSRS